MSEKNYDVVIIGAGPAGLSAALYSARALLKTAVIEKSVIGGLITQTTEIENYPGSAEGVTGTELTLRMKEQAEKAGAEFIYDEITNIKKEENLFSLSSLSEALYSCKAVIIASGTVPRLLGIDGEREFRGRGVSYCATCDAGFFKDRVVSVIGGGDTALKEADYLSKFASKVMVFHRREELRASVAVKNSALSNEKISIFYNSLPQSINGKFKVESLTVKDKLSEELKDYPTDGVFIFAGYVPDSKVYADFVNTDEAGYIITDENMRTSTKGIYAAGDIRKKSLKQVITAASDGATAAVEAEEYIAELTRQ